MRLGIDVRRAAAAAIAAIAAVAALLLAVGPASAAAPGVAPTRQEVQAQVQQLKADPDLGGTRKQKTLRFKKGDDTQPEPPDPSSLRWLRELFDWIARTARVLVWALGALALALLLVGLRHWMRVRAPALVGPAPLRPSHVRNLDIRPESLPEAIGAAAAALWREGEHLPALSLLYRGALSRLVHAHAVPIRQASTEDECVALAQARLDAASGAFVAALVGAWQLAVYGARWPETERVLALCHEFDLHLAPAAAAPKRSLPP